MAAPNPCAPCDCNNFFTLTSSPGASAAAIMAILCQILTQLQTAGGCSCVVDDAAVDAEDTANLIAGTDGTNYQILSVDAQGRLNVNVTPTTSSATNSSTAAPTGVTSVVLAANASRKGGWVKNIDVANVYVAFGATATVLTPTLLEPGASLLFENGGVLYTGAVAAITGGGTGSLEIVELV